MWQILILTLTLITVEAKPGGEQLWKFFTEFGVSVVQPVSDLSGNGGMDLLVGAADDTLYLVEGQGQNSGKALWQAPFKGTLNSIANLPDVNGDGRSDVLAGDQFGLMQCLSGASGQVLWKYLTFGTVLSTLAIPDANADGVGDAVFGSEDDTVYCLSGKPSGLLGKVIWQFGIPALKKNMGGGGPKGLNKISQTVAAPPSADIIASGANDLAAIKQGSSVFGIVVGTSSDTVYCLKMADGIPKWKAGFPGDIWKVTAFPDQNGDGIEEILAACGADLGYLLSGADGKILWSLAVMSGATSVAVAGDMDGDGNPDALIGDGNGQVHCVSGKSSGLNVKSAWTFNFGDMSTIESIASMGDLDGDNSADCVVGTSNNTVAVINGKGVKSWSVDLGGTIWSVGNLGDIDGNGVADIAAGTEMGFASALSGGGALLSTKLQNGRPKIRNQIDGYSLSWARKSQTDFAVADLEYHLPTRDYITLDVLDFAGHHLKTIYHGPASAGKNKVAWKSGYLGGQDRGAAGFVVLKVKSKPVAWLSLESK
jgi:PQQ-like domain